MTVKALDLSYGAYYVTAEWCAARIAEGFRLLVVDAWLGASSPDGVERALRLWREAGGIAAAYYVPHAYRTPEYHLDKAQAAIGLEWSRLAFVAIDIETIGNYPPTEQWQADHVWASVNLITARKQRPIIYSGFGAWTWSQLPPVLSELPLWDAWHNNRTDLAMIQPYGGWTSSVGHQYTNTTLVDGVECDLNVFDDVWVKLITAQSTADVNAAEVAQLHRRWADAQELHAHAGRIEAEVVERKVALGLQ